MFAKVSVRLIAPQRPNASGTPKKTNAERRKIGHLTQACHRLQKRRRPPRVRHLHLRSRVRHLKHRRHRNRTFETISKGARFGGRRAFVL